MYVMFAEHVPIGLPSNIADFFKMSICQDKLINHSYIIWKSGTIAIGQPPRVIFFRISLGPSMDSALLCKSSWHCLCIVGSTILYIEN